MIVLGKSISCGKRFRSKNVWLTTQMDASSGGVERNSKLGEFMKLAIVLCVTAGASLITGCATKRYPIATELSAVEQRALTCRELAIELAKADEIEAKITDTATTDWRSVAGFLGDYGIGNAMAKSEAAKALSERRMSIKAAQVSRGCSDAALPADEPTSTSSEARAAEIVRQANQ